MESLSPRYTAALFRPLLRELIVLLRALEPAGWERATMAGAWRVRDVAAHLLDGDFRKLAVVRDGQRLPLDGPAAPEQDLARFINGLNADGVRFATRWSPRLITDLLEITGNWIADFVAQLPPHAPAVFAVSWAGEAISENWMDTGREYTERWHHQMQIRDAVGAPLLLSSEWFEPLLDISVRTLPHAYTACSASTGTTVTFEVPEHPRAIWSVIRTEGGWALRQGRPPHPDALVRARADDAWRLFYNGLSSGQMVERLEIVGDRRLVTPLLNARSVIL